MSSLSRGAPPATYFTHPQAVPILLLPWWLEATIRGTPSRAFQRDVVYSTVNGYYLVRMVDDLMDGDAPPPAPVLPALSHFQIEFSHPLVRYFPYGHPFWDSFSDSWFAGAEAASVDAGSESIDRARFVDVSAKKIAAAKVPLAAVGHRYDRTDLLQPWDGFVDRFGAWHQMFNDIVGWHRDLEAGRTTYFLCQAASRKASSESIAEWVISEGLAWGRTELEAWMDELELAARGLGCPPLSAYLDERRRVLDQEWQRLLPDLVGLRRLASALR